MHDDSPKALGAAAFEQQVAEMFDEAERCPAAKRALARGDTEVRAPIIGIIYDSWSEKDTEKTKRWACNALAARAQLKKDHPSWPDLPVRAGELHQLQWDLSREDARLHILLMYALSLSYHHWDPQHPSFRDFVCSAMADKRTPHTIRENEELKKEFPPVPIVKLFRATEDIRFLYWCGSKMTASFKAEQAFDKARASGASVEAAREAGRRAYREILSIQ